MKRHGWVLAAALAISIFAGQALPPAGTPQLPLPRSVAPTLKIEDADPAAAKAVGLEGLNVNVELSGPLAQTTVTMTFRNTLNRPLEGELEFPLPEGAAVVGYALDVPAGSGILVEGVAIAKERARRIFESEERRGVDPGIVELTRGNNYRTRVHPIPAGGTRTVQLTYVSDLVSAGGASIYKLPLDFGGEGGNLKSAKIRVEVAGAAKPEEVKVAGLPGMAFVQGEGSVVAEKALGNVALSGTLMVTVPAKGEDYVAVEKRVRGATLENLNAPAAEEHYFLISSVIDEMINAEVARPGTVAIIWDTNLSRATTDKSAEIAAVRALMKQLKDVRVQLVTTTDLQARSFAVAGGNSDELIKAIEGLTYDGALRIDSMIIGGAADNRSDSQPRTVRADMALFVTNGLVTMGENHFGIFSGSHAPVYTLSADPQADHAMLKRLAEETGGIYLNLQRLSPERAAETLLEPRVVASLSWDQNKPVIDEVYPKGSVPVVMGERVAFSGRLLAPEATAVLSVGIAGGKMETREIKLRQAKGAGTEGMGIVPRFWAQQKGAWLSADSGKNADALVALAKDFNLVTPETSLLVLETADQYLRYGVVPPKSRLEVYQEFAKRVEQEGAEKKKAEGAKIEHILALWKGRVEWWEKEFKVPTKEELAKEKTKPGMETAAAIGGQFDATAQPMPAMSVQASTAPGATGGHGGGGGAFGGGGGRGGGGGAGLFQDQSNEPNRAATQAGDVRAPTVNLQSLSRYGTALEEKSVGNGADEAAIAIKPWSPDTPYLRAMAAASAGKAYEVYLAQRKENFATPSFYLDCGNWLLEHGQREMGIRVLTDIAQLRLESAALLRVAAYRLLQVQAYREAIDLFERAKVLRPDEPQSWRDLALAVSEEALGRTWAQNEMDMPKYERQMADLLRAMDLYNHVVMNQWDRFDEIEVVALMEANALWAKIQRLPGYEIISKQHAILNPLDSRLVKNLDCDVRVVMTWDADVTDIDLHVIEPTGQEAFYGYNRTLAGGLVSHDFTQGYGPEEYLIHHAVPGTYKIAANFFGSQQQSVQGPVTVQATVITNFGRPNEKRQSMTLRLTEQKETVPIGEVLIDPAK